MKVTLHTSAIAAQAHGAVVLPWLKRAAESAPRSPLATAVLVPLRADAYHLKSLALTAGIGLGGVHFLTPLELRGRLARRLRHDLRTPSREHLRLLLATAAERVAERCGAAFRSAAAAPDQVLKAIELIRGGGWNFSDAGPAALRPVVEEFDRLLNSAGFAMTHDADRALLAAADSASPIFSELLVFGFNAAHWPLLPLLEAAVVSAQFATVCLTDPRTEAEDLDAAWVGTWEEKFGAAQPIDAEFTSPLSVLLDARTTTRTRAEREPEPPPGLAFLVGRDTVGQARAIVAHTLGFLSDPACERVGVLFPSAGALSRQVADLLADLDVPHHDGLAHHAPGPLEDAAWPAWLALQEIPRLPALLRFLRARSGDDFGGMPGAQAADELESAYSELLLDDLSALAALLRERHARRRSQALAAAMDALPFLPERATLAAFFESTGAIFDGLGWTQRAENLRRLEPEWRAALNLAVSRHAWLRWLEDSLDSWRTERAPAGAHPYSRLHLLPYSQAESQSWTHLIAAGMNEGQWPPSLEDAGFVGEEEIDALNRRLGALNARVKKQGRQGEGHIVVEPGRAFCLGPAQRRAIAARQFFNTLESVSVAAAVSAQLHDEAAPERPLNPGEFFTRLYFCARGRAVAQHTMAALHAETARWLDAGGLWKTPAPDLSGVQPTLHAYVARRAQGKKFGEYEFALRNPPQPPLRLAAKRWEDAMKSPAEAWLGAVLGVGACGGDEETQWDLAQGTWVHEWLRALAGKVPPNTFVPLPAPADLTARVRAAATAFRGHVSAILAARGRALPEWWASAWEQALSIALPLAASVAGVAGRTHAATEWKFEDTAIPIDGSALHIRGRIDLLLTTGDSIENAWVIDYKTGNRKPLRTRDLATGDGVQIALYALALRAAGAQSVGMSLLTADTPIEEPQLSLSDLDGLMETWRGLLQMQDTGVFGARGALRDEYKFRGDYPLATLAIDEEILDEKWKLTHPNFDTTEDAS
jgi:hypothetical protein